MTLAEQRRRARQARRMLPQLRDDAWLAAMLIVGVRRFEAMPQAEADAYGYDRDALLQKARRFRRQAMRRLHRTARGIENLVRRPTVAPARLSHVRTRRRQRSTRRARARSPGRAPDRPRPSRRDGGAGDGS